MQKQNSQNTHHLPSPKSFRGGFGGSLVKYKFHMGMQNKLKIQIIYIFLILNYSKTAIAHFSYRSRAQNASVGTKYFK